MKFIDLIQPPKSEGQPTTSITAVVDKIQFTFKQPLMPVFMVSLAGVVMPCLGDYNDVLEHLGLAGFTIFDTPEGSKTAINPEHVCFYANSELGIYNLMFVGKVGLTVKATKTDITEMFQDKPNIVV